MQAFNYNELLETLQGPQAELEARKEELLASGKATRVVIGRLPERGQEVEINGLTFFVFNVMEQSGKVFLQLKKPSPPPKEE